MSISAITGKDTSTERYQCHPEQGYFHTEVSVPSLRYFHRRYQCYLEQGMLPQGHQCYPSTTLGQGCSDQGHQSSISIGTLLLLNYIWMTPDVVPTKTIHYRFLILKKPSNLTMYLCPWCKDKSTWRQSIVYIVETGITVFEVNWIS